MLSGLQDLQDGRDQEATQADLLAQLAHKVRPVTWQVQLAQLAQEAIL